MRKILCCFCPRGPLFSALETFSRKLSFSNLPSQFLSTSAHRRARTPRWTQCSLMRIDSLVLPTLHDKCVNCHLVIDITKILSIPRMAVLDAAHRRRTECCMFCSERLLNSLKISEVARSFPNCSKIMASSVQSCLYCRLEDHSLLLRFLKTS